MGNNGDKEEIKEASLTIKYTPNGVIDLKGSVIENEMMAIFLLEKAKDMIKAHAMQKVVNQPKIAKPNGIINFVRGNNRR